VFDSDRDGQSELYVMNTDGSNAVRLTRSEGGNGHASFSPDGSRIYFTRGQSGNQDVWVMNADGSNQVRLTTTPGPGPLTGRGWRSTRRGAGGSSFM
jgi:Tol biopolymer transport system component